jgi:archaellum component FlaC
MAQTMEYGTMATRNSTATMTHESKQNSLLFGSLNESIADAVYQSLERHLMPLLQALPVLAKDARSQLQERILRKYLPAADLVELYGQRNVFSLQMIEPPSRRKMILQVFELCDNMEIASLLESFMKNDSMDSNNHVNNDDEVESVKNLHKADIPTAKDIQSVEEELHTLSLQLQQLKQQRQKLSSDLSILKSLNENHHNAPVSKQEMKDIPKQVQEQISIANALRECQNDSSNLQLRMESIQRDREGNLEAIVHPPTTTMSRPKAFTLQERYEHDYEQLGSISAQSLASLTLALKK